MAETGTALTSAAAVLDALASLGGANGWCSEVVPACTLADAAGGERGAVAGAASGWRSGSDKGDLSREDY